MIGPRVPEHRRRAIIRTIDLPGPFGIALNVDSPLFINLAREPSRLLEPRNYRQSRPLMIWLAAAGNVLLRPVFGDAAHLSYVLLNVVVLTAAFLLFLRIVRPVGDVAPPVLAAGLLLLFNDLTKLFLYSPHTQLFNVLCPMFALWVAHLAWHERIVERPAAYALALLAGVGMLAYGTFVLSLPAMLVPAAVRATRERRGGMRLLVRAAVMTALFLVPTAAWYLFVVTRTGAFYSAEVEVYRQFVWMRDLLPQGVPAVARRLEALVGLFLWNSGYHAIPALVMIIGLIAIAPSVAGHLAALRTDAALALLVSALFTVFFTLSGFIPSRLSYSAAAPWVAFAGALARVADTEGGLSTRSARRWGVLLATLAWGVLLVVWEDPKV